SLANRVARAIDPPRSERAQSAVGGALVVERRRRGEVAPLDERDRQSARSRLVCRHQSVNAPADDEHVERGGAEGFEIAPAHVGELYWAPMPDNGAVRDYWNVHIHDLEISSHAPGTREFFADLDQYHFEKLHHLLRLVDFSGQRGKRVLEVGCGAGTDLLR